MIQIKEKTMEFEQNERICNEVQELKISMERRMNVCDIEVEELRLVKKTFFKLILCFIIYEPNLIKIL